MLKIIKVKKLLNLPELIEYLWNNEITPKIYYAQRNGKTSNKYVRHLGGSKLVFHGDMYDDDRFEFDEKINENTEFESLYHFKTNGQIYESGYHTVKDVIKSSERSNNLDALHHIYAKIDGKLVLIWERDNQ